MSQVFSGQKLLQRHCPFENAEDKPTFFFGKHNGHFSAEIEDDSHFENLADVIRKYSLPNSDLQHLDLAEKLQIVGSVPILFQNDRFKLNLVLEIQQ